MKHEEVCIHIIILKVNAQKLRNQISIKSNFYKTSY